ncbi:hypothetical protein Hanom_Chr14g01314651 [Helianthus anomalus]
MVILLMHRITPPPFHLLHHQFHLEFLRQQRRPWPPFDHIHHHSRERKMKALHKLRMWVFLFSDL